MQITALDKKDRRILFELELNSRQSLPEIASKVGLSKQVVEYRIRRLQESGVVAFFYPLVDFSRLGFTSFKLYLRFQNLDIEKEKEIIGYWVGNKNSLWVGSCRGSWDLAVSFMARTPFEIGTMMDDFLGRFGSFVLEKDILVTQLSPVFSKTYLPEQKERNEFVFGNKPQSHELDETGKKLLHALSNQGRASISELSMQTGLSRDTVSYRLKKLEGDGILAQYRPWLNVEKIGLRIYKVLLRLYNISPEREAALVRFVKQRPSGTQYLKLLGSWDAEMEFEIGSEEQLHEVVLALRKEFSDIIRDYSLLAIQKTYKLTYWPF